MKYIPLVALILVAGCGNFAVDNELVGQVKKTMHNTPIFCPNFDDADMSLGVVRNGTGSYSTQDVWVNIPDPQQLKLIKTARDKGQLVKITYDHARFVICVNERTATKVEILK